MPSINHRSEEEIRKDNRIKALSQQNEALEAKLEYVAMITDVDIDTETNEVEEG